MVVVNLYSFCVLKVGLYLVMVVMFFDFVVRKGIIGCLCGGW